MILRVLATSIVALAIAAPALAEPAQDPAIAKIIDEGMQRSEVMKTASALFDGIGPRLTNSDNQRKAQAWAIALLKSYGLANVHEEPFHFGLGWNLDSYAVNMVTPRKLALTVIPIAWSPPTEGTLTAPVIVAPMSKEEHLARWKGKLTGKIVLISMPGETSESKDAVFQRYTDKDIAEFDHYDQPVFDPLTKPRWLKSLMFAERAAAFAKAEGAVAVVTMAYRDGKLVSGEGYHFQPGHTLALPAVQMAQEDYRRLVRLAATGTAPQLSVTVAAHYDDRHLDATNIIAEIPGSDPKAGVVMAGAHFDSWIAADGANDNGAGSVALIEAARLIQKLGIKPRRTIRFALWAGEEQGLLGSEAYVSQHFATRAIDPALTGIEAYLAWDKAFPITPKPEYATLKAYFNVDNGSGKLRGIYTEGNPGVNALLGDWLAPFKSMGAGALVASKTHGTDHESYQALGLNGYQFIQDPLDYETRVHHSTLDTLDHMRADDMRQISVVWAGVLWQAATSDKDLPHPPLPTQPVPTDPFKVADPDD
ncbi:peptidase M28 [Novosphingobium sp. FSW06-99]|nr:M20/M25/M40 family metallo-hydrolase [Novosphingobium sp. FSW06-99]KUR76497.1 peptidase M28 [Novosphingobium sp. FSW06-99]